MERRARGDRTRPPPHVDERVGRRAARRAGAVAEELDATPTSVQMDTHGAYSADTYRRHFGSWNAALEAIGHEPHHTSARVSRDELLDELERLAEERDRRPTATDVVEAGAHGLATYQRQFGSWSAALEEAFDGEGARNGGSE
ncbi:homing endonuclease associated repeat-containing protein [Halorubrum saccharovorum]|uniref:homing endonuclease associated repeat-containing protein n=1 Tax=Halorubrum saccharovorum TaxID=2248 RepID=UPI002285F7BB|nr:hypothetical protein [Halorubrum saccharovorum]